MLELRDLARHYPTVGGEVVRAVDGVSLQVQAGEMVALYGPSGSGKTTLLLMTATLLAPSSGTVLIGGRDVSSLSEREASHFRLSELGFIRQNFDLLPGVSTIDNAVLKLLKTMRWREAQREVTPLLERLGLCERLQHRAETEAGLLLGVGCCTGAIFGLYGQQLADRALADAVNFPVVYSVTAPAALLRLAMVALAALAILAVPGYLAARVPASLALQD